MLHVFVCLPCGQGTAWLLLQMFFVTAHHELVLIATTTADMSIANLSASQPDQPTNQCGEPVWTKEFSTTGQSNLETGNSTLLVSISSIVES